MYPDPSSLLPAPPPISTTWLAYRACEHVTVHVAGEIDIATAPELVTAMREALVGGRQLTVDLSGATFFGVSGANALAQARCDADRLGGSVRVTGASDLTRRLLEVTGLGDLLDVSIAPISQVPTGRLDAERAERIAGGALR